MSKILFRLSGVSDEEAAEVRELLINNEIDYYETSPGNWGVSIPAIWLKDENQFPSARLLLDEYQKTRTIKVREEYARLKKAGQNKIFTDNVKEKPVQLFAYLLIVCLVLYLSAKLVIDLGK